MNLKQVLNWRYAVKKFKDEKVSEEKVRDIVEAINLSASSSGIQPYRLIVVSDKELQRELGQGSFNSQITEASHLIVFAALENIHQHHISNYMQLISDVRDIPVAQLTDFKNVLEGYLLNRSQEDNFLWATRQAYIALGTALVAAAEQEIDATPMEGFNAGRFDELLNLKEKGLRSVVILALGYRDAENDSFSQSKKVRLALEDFVLN